MGLIWFYRIMGNGLPIARSRKGAKQMDALIDVLMYVVIIGTAIIAIAGLGCGIVGMAHKIKRAGRDTQRVESNRKRIRRRMGKNALQPVYLVHECREKPHMP